MKQHLIARLAAERAARVNVSQGACTSGAQLVYIAKLQSMLRHDLVTKKKAEQRVTSDGFIEVSPGRFRKVDAAGVSAEEKAAAMGDGWIAHDGGPCPVPDDVEVFYRMKDGEEHNTKRPARVNQQLTTAITPAPQLRVFYTQFKEGEYLNSVVDWVV